MIIEVGDFVRSTMGNHPRGRVVGYASIQWPDPEDNTVHGDDKFHLAYIVQVREGSSSLGPACIIMRSDRVELSEAAFVPPRYVGIQP